MPLSESYLKRAIGNARALKKKGLMGISVKTLFTRWYESWKALRKSR